MNVKKKIVTIVSKDAFTKKGLLESIEKGLIPDNAISWAAENGHTELVELLVSKGADITENRNYPLELASRNGHTEIVKLLIDSGARTYDSELDEGYCLRLAANEGHVEIIKLLLDAGANPVADNYHALYLALTKRNNEIVELLLDAICQKRTSVVQKVKNNV